MNAAPSFEGRLIGLDRSRLPGFMAYWSERKWHFHQVYNRKFTLDVAREVFETEIAQGATFLDTENMLRELDGEETLQ